MHGLSVEQALARLEEVVRRLETGSASLDESILLYEEGKELYRLLAGRLEETRARIERIIDLGDEGASSEPFSRPDDN